MEEKLSVVRGRRHVKAPRAHLCPCPSPRYHTHRDQCLKEAIEKQVPKEAMRTFHPWWEVRHKPDEEVGNDGQGSGEDDPEEKRGV